MSGATEVSATVGVHRVATHESVQVSRDEWIRELKTIQRRGGYAVADKPVDESSSISKFIAVYSAAIDGHIDETLMRIDGALHVRQMVVDCEDYVACVASQRLVQYFEEEQWKRSVARLLKEGESRECLFPTWNNYKGFKRGCTKIMAAQMDQEVRAVQESLGIQTYYGAMMGAKQAGNEAAHPTDLWDEEIMYEAINTVYDPLGKRTRSNNKRMKALYELYKTIVFEGLKEFQ